MHSCVWSRWAAETENQYDEERWFKLIWTRDGCCQPSVFQNCWSYRGQPRYADHLWMYKSSCLAYGFKRAYQALLICVYVHCSSKCSLIIISFLHYMTFSLGFYLVIVTCSHSCIETITSAPQNNLWVLWTWQTRFFLLLYWGMKRSKKLFYMFIIHWSFVRNHRCTFLNNFYAH